MTREQLLDHYRAVLEAGESMRTAAQLGDWQTVAGLSLRIRAITNQLNVYDPAKFLGRTANNERLAILTKLIHIDAEVRYLREPWVAKIDALITPRSEPAQASFDR